MKFRWITVAGAVALGSVTLCASSAKPNIIFILVDDLGVNDLACYGSEFYDTPAIDALARSGTLFTNAYAASPVCSPTRSAIMTGRHPVRTGITDWIPGYAAEAGSVLTTPEVPRQLELSEVTIAEVLKEHGYATGFFGKWHLGMKETHWPEHQGFEINIGGIDKGTPPGGYYSPYRNPRLQDGPEGEYLTNRLTDEAIAFAREHKDQPFFAFLSFYNVHTPIQGYRKWDDYYEQKRSELAADQLDTFEQIRNARTRRHQSDPLYAAMVRAVDDNVGRIVSAIGDLQLDERTIIVFTSDNGGLATRVGKQPGPTSNYPWRAGKGWCFEGGIRVPLIIRAPGRGNPDTRSGQVAVSMDLMPTLLDLAGVPLRPDLHIDGNSLSAAIDNPAHLQPRTLVWHYPHYHVDGWTPGAAIRSGDWKLIHFFETGNRALYHLADDPCETYNRAEELPRRMHELSDALSAILRRMNATLPRRR